VEKKGERDGRMKRGGGNVQCIVKRRRE